MLAFFVPKGNERGVAFPLVGAVLVAYNVNMWRQKTLVFSYLCLLWANPLFGQDERRFREMLTGESSKDWERLEKARYHFQTRSPRYQMDMDGDNLPESFVVAKRDGQDWLYIYDRYGNEIFRYRFANVGPWSRIFKIGKVKLSEKATLFLIHYYEGATRYLEFRGTARYYFLTMDDNNPKKLFMEKGPIFWDEFRGFKEHYHQRKYKFSIADFNQDGIKDFSLRYHLINKVYSYRLKGKWVTFQKKSLGMD